MKQEERKKRLAIAGCGFLGNILMDAWKKGLLPEYEIAGVLGRDEERAAFMAAKAGCPVFRDSLMDAREEEEVFAGNTKEAIKLLPTKVNVSVAASLATAGTEKTRFSIVSVPGMTGDDHRITAEVEGVKAVVDIYSDTSAIAAWSVVALLRNLVSPIMF